MAEKRRHGLERRAVIGHMRAAGMVQQVRM